MLVILAILAAIMIPALTGWIEKANKKAAIAEARTALMAVQTVASENYNKSDLKISNPGQADDGQMNDDYVKEASKLAELEGKQKIDQVILLPNNKVSSMTYISSEGHDVVYVYSRAEKFEVDPPESGE